MSVLSDNLKTLRQAKGVYQKEVANWLGIDRTTYVKYERGQSSPDHDVLLELANYFSVSVDYLLGKSDTPAASQQKGVKIPVLDRSDSQALDIKNGTDKRLEIIIKSYQELNDAGKDDLLKYAEHLIYIPEYKKGDTSTSEKSKIG